MKKIVLFFIIFSILYLYESHSQSTVVVYQKGTQIFEESAELTKLAISPKKLVPVEKDNEERAKAEIINEKDSIGVFIGPSAISIGIQAGFTKFIGAGLPNPLLKTYSTKKEFSFVTLYPEPKILIDFLTKYFEAKSIGIVFTSAVNQEMADYLKNYFENNGLKCKLLGINSPQELAAPFPYFLSQVNVVLLLIDPLAYNKEAVKFMMIKSIEKKVPIIGFSEAICQLGIPISIFLTPEQLSDVIKRAVKDKLSGSQNFLFFSTDFKLSINEEACKVLGVKYDEGKVIKRY